MTVGELFLKLGMKVDEQQINSAFDKVNKLAEEFQKKVSDSDAFSSMLERLEEVEKRIEKISGAVDKAFDKNKIKEFNNSLNQTGNGGQNPPENDQPNNNNNQKNAQKSDMDLKGLISTVKLVKSSLGGDISSMMSLSDAAATIGTAGAIGLGVVAEIGLVVGATIAAIKIVKKQIADVQKGLASLKSLVNSLISPLKNLAAQFGISFDPKPLEQMLESMERINQQLSSMIGNSQSLSRVQSDVLRIANNTKSTYSDMARLISYARNSANISHRFVQWSDSQINDYVEGLVTMFQAGGATNENAISMANDVVRGFLSGKVNGKIIEDMETYSPQAFQWLANATWGGDEEGRQKLRYSAAESLLTPENFNAAMIQNADEIAEAYENIYFSFGDLVKRVKNDFSDWLYRLNKETGFISSAIKTIKSAYETYIKPIGEKIITWIKENQKTVQWFKDNLLNIVEIIGGTAGLITVFKVLTAVLTLANLKAALFIATMLAIALVVQDVYYFMSGDKKSLLGKLLGDDEEKTNKVKGKINELIDAFKGLFEAIKNALGFTGDSFFEDIKSWIEDLPNNIDKIIKKVEKISDIIKNISWAVALFTGHLDEWHENFDKQDSNNDGRADVEDTYTRNIVDGNDTFTSGRIIWGLGVLANSNPILGPLLSAFGIGKTLFGLGEAGTGLGQWIDRIRRFFGGKGNEDSDTTTSDIATAVQGIWGIIQQESDSAGVTASHFAVKPTSVKTSNTYNFKFNNTYHNTSPTTATQLQIKQGALAALHYTSKSI